MKFELYGLYDDFFSGQGSGEMVRVLVATFDTREEAEAYIKRSFVAPQDRLYKRNPYHSASVLGAYFGHELEEGEGIPHNPPMNW